MPELRKRTHQVRYDNGFLSAAASRPPGAMKARGSCRLLAAKKITPIIDRTYPLADPAQAHAYLESQRQTGKVLLLP
jgi:NADPH:quinone reductase-like Zn-dependent oxidoreductase